MPPIGVFDWSDLWFLAMVIAAFPLILSVLPRIAVAALAALLVALSAVDLGRTVGPSSRPAHRVTGLVAVLLCVSLWVLPRNPAVVATICDALLVPVVLVAALTWAQTSMRMCHLAVLVVLLTGYDLLATTWAGLTGPLIRELAVGRPALAFAVPLRGGTLTLGIGDVLVAVVVPLVLIRERGARAGAIAAVACVSAYSGGLALALTHPGHTIALMITLGPAALLAMVTGSRTGQRRWAHVARTVTDREGAGTMQP